MFLTDFHMQKYTGGIILWVGIFLTVTPAIAKVKNLVKIVKMFWTHQRSSSLSKYGS